MERTRAPSSLLLITILLFTGGRCDVPTREDVLAAIMEARECNTARRLGQVHVRARRQSQGGERSYSRCPALMSAYHGTASLYNQTKAYMAEDMLKATEILMNKGFSLPEIQSPVAAMVFMSEFDCPTRTMTCDPNAKYRTADGSCNNINNPSWGMAGAAEIRDLNMVAYDNGLDSPRTKSYGGGDLPSARVISNKVHNQDSAIFSESLALTMFTIGQFLDHDLGLTEEAELNENCCDPIEENNPNCFNIQLDGPNDPIMNGENCMPFIRSAPVLSSCNPGPREQPNSITHFIDCSNIYGSTLERQKELRYEDSAFVQMRREKDEGSAFLQMRREKGEGMGSYWRLPNDPDPELFLCESDEASGFFCSLAGDVRVNDVPTLTSVHQMGVKEHNRVAWKLRKYFDDQETLFQETRRIVIAQFQYIIYNEFLPKIFSQETMEKYGLWSTAPYEYNKDVDPTLSNEFLISYRFHTWIPPVMKIMTPDMSPMTDIRGRVDPDSERQTDDTFFRMDMTYFFKKYGWPRKRLQGLDGLLHYAASTPAQATDRFMVDSIRNNLFKDIDTNTALDLVSFNIQRGRDHGLPSYNEYRIFCGLSSGPITCDDLTDHDPETRECLRDAYNNECNDIDLWAGAHTERPVPGSVVGPLLQCILGRQFQRSKYGDRFWYQNADAGFSKAQIREIEKTSLSRMLCDNMDFDRVARDSFAKPDVSNFVRCGEIPKPNLRKFKPRRDWRNRESDEANNIVSTEGDDATDDVYREGNDDTDDAVNREFREFFESWVTPGAN